MPDEATQAGRSEGSREAAAEPEDGGEDEDEGGGEDEDHGEGDGGGEDQSTVPAIVAGVVATPDRSASMCRQSRP